jgi:uncharacterized tellurite resistance protein B-like protein|tara:strand:+ start:1719 stop:2147 length:429 start_codon:yes stop_codon:yes gene_type:complete
MINFFKNNDTKKKVNDNDLLSKTASLLIYAAKIDQNFTKKEKEIIKKGLITLGANSSNINELIKNSETNEEQSVQILEFTKIIKKTDVAFKTKIIETLWTIIYSDKEEDMYESNLMRRLSGLLYLDNRIVGSIKEKVKKKFS